MTRVIITGSRHWDCASIASRVLDRLRARYKNDLVIVHGDCPRGVDRAFSDRCTLMQLAQERYPADWDSELGLRAGPARNQEMIDAGANFVVAVSHDLRTSQGTLDCVTRALRAGLAVYLIESDESEPRRIWMKDLG